MLVVPGIVSFGMATIAGLGSFFAARFLVARKWVGGGVNVPLGFEHAPWIGASRSRRIAFALTGPLACYALSAILFAASLLVGGKPTIDPSDMHLWVTTDGPAATAGIRGGDEILTIDDASITSWPELIDQIAKHSGEKLRIAVRHRDGQTQSFDVTAGPSGKIGVSPQSKVEKVGIGSAIATGTLAPLRVWITIARNFGKILSDAPDIDAVGPSARARVTAGGTLELVATLIAYYFLILSTMLSIVFWPGARWFVSTRTTREK
jgi:membrane-associated protease RseP (regulator of RpoE activity)